MHSLSSVTFFFCFSLFSLFSFGSTDQIDCHGVHSIDPPENLSEPWFFPTGWTDSGDPPQFAANQNCSWRFTVPKGIFVFLTITTSTDPFTVTLTDSFGNWEWIYVSASREPYFLLDPGFSVNLGARTVGQLGMRVLWTKVGPFQPVSHQMALGDVPFVLSSGAFDNGTVISSASRVSLVSLPPPSSFANLAPYMRNTLVFDGPTINDKYLGNLWQIYDSGNQVVSSGKYLTLYYLMPNLMLNNYILLQDYRNVERFSTYKGIACSASLCAVAIDGRNGSAAAVRMSGSPHYLKQVALGNSTLQTTFRPTLGVYTGKLREGNMLRLYSSSQMGNELPQQFNGLFTTYVANNGVGAVYISYDANNIKWNNAFDGRDGLLVSKNFGVSSADQNVLETFGGSNSQKLKITLNVKQAGLDGDATLTVTVADGKKTMMDTKYTSGQLAAGASIVSTGTSFTVNYDTHGSKTSGINVEFSFENGAKSSGYAVLIMMLAAAASIW